MSKNGNGMYPGLSPEILKRVSMGGANTSLVGSQIAGLLLGVLGWKFGVDLSGFEAQAAGIIGWILARYVSPQ